MRIISPYKDYYDTALGFGIDKSVMFNRKRKEHIVPEIMPSNTFTINTKDNSSRVFFAVILFCGKAFPFLYHHVDDHTEKLSCFFSMTDYLKYISTPGFENTSVIKRNKSSPKYFWMKTEKDLMSFTMSESQIKDLHFQYNSPIIVLKKSEDSTVQKTKTSVLVNEPLKQYSFFKIHPPYQAFQEIDMYVSGVLGTGQADIINISDEDMSKKKGFDKYSFRKMPTKRR